MGEPARIAVYRVASSSVILDHADALEAVLLEAAQVRSGSEFSIDAFGSIQLRVPDRLAGSSPALPEAEVGARCRRFMAEVNEMWREAHPEAALPRVFPSGVVSLSVHSEATGGGVGWWSCDFGVELHPSQGEEAVPVQGAFVRVLLGGEDLSVAGLDWYWRPVVGIDLVARTPPGFLPGATLSDDMEVIVGGGAPQIMYRLRVDDELVKPLYLGFTSEYGGEVPAWNECSILEKRELAWSLLAGDEGQIASIEDLPNSQYAILAAFEGTRRQSLEPFEGDSAFWTRLHQALDYYELVVLDLWSGRARVNEGWVPIDMVASYQVEHTDGERAAIGIELFDGASLSLSVHLRDACTADQRLSFASEAGVEFEFLDEGLAACEEPVPSPAAEAESPDRVLMLTPDGGGLAVVTAHSDLSKGDVEAELQKAELSDDVIVTTLGELQETLERERVPFVSYQNAVDLGVFSSSVHVPLLDRVAIDLFSRPNRAHKWAGDIGELARLTRSGWLDGNLEGRQWVTSRGHMRVGNHPIWDTVGRLFGEELYQVKTSRGARASSRYGTYLRGLHDIMGGAGSTRRTNLFTRTAEHLLKELPLADRRRVAMQRGRLVINPDDVDGFRTYARGKMLDNPGRYTAYFDALMDEAPLELDGQRIRSMQDLDGAAARRRLTAAQRQRGLDSLASRSLRRILPNHRDLTTATLQRWHAARSSMPASAVDVSDNVSPEQLLVDRVGVPRAAGRASVRGAKFGFGAGLVLEFGTQTFTEESYDFLDLAATGTVSGVGTGIGGGVQVGASEALRQLGVKAAGRSVGSGGIAGAVVAPIIELGTMAYEELFEGVDHRAEDYVARGGKAAVGGLISGAIGLGATMAATGMAAGGAGGSLAGGVGAIPGALIGAVVGFVVGAGAYLVYDLLIGGYVETGIRKAYQLFDPPNYRVVGVWERDSFGFFAVPSRVLTLEDEVEVELTGHYAKQINPVDDAEELMIEVTPASAAARVLFGQRPSRFVSASLLSPI
jgi:hypothetical protein